MSISTIVRNMLPKKSSTTSDISLPLSVTKQIHVSFDPKTKTFQGLPAEWEEQVKNLFP